MALRFSRLDRPSIRRLQPGSKVTEHGITAERLPDRDIRYSVNIMVDGQRIHRVIGLDSDGVTRSQAEQFIQAKRTEARERRLSLPSKRKLALTFATAADLYLSKERAIKAKNLPAKDQHIRLYLKPYFGSMHLDRISTFTLEKFKRRCLDKGLATATVNRVFATYRHMARKLIEWGDIKTPMPMIKLDKEHNERSYVLTRDECGRLLKAALNDSNAYIWLFIKIGLGTGMRHSEILSTRFEHFDPIRRRLGAKVKGGFWREQPLPREIVTILERECSMADDPQGWIFPSKITKTGHMTYMDSAFERCVVRAKLDPGRVIPHTMRHTAITLFARSNADVATVKAYSGHKSLQMVMRYVHPDDEHVNDVLDSLEDSGTESEQIKGPEARNS